MLAGSPPRREIAGFSVRHRGRGFRIDKPELSVSLTFGWRRLEVSDICPSAVSKGAKAQAIRASDAPLGIAFEWPGK